MEINDMLRSFLVSATLLVVTGIMLAPSARAAGSDDDDGFNVPPTAPTGNRQGGGARGNNDDSADKTPYTLSILSPADSVGLTAREQPVIYWYLSHDAKSPIRVAILIPKKPKALFEQELPVGTKAGINKIDLTKEQQNGKPVKLEPGVTYTVTVKVMKAGSGSAGDPFASCKIVRVEPDKAPADAADAANESDPAKRAAAYGKAGLWFDYLDALNQAIAAKPSDDALLQKRAKALAKQRLIWKPDGTITEERKADAKQ